MSDKTKKDYDPTVMRAAGNILAGSDILNWPSESEEAAWKRERAIKNALAIRDRLRKVDPQGA
jgi:hypothetical protein